MLPHDRVQPAAQGKPSWPARIMRWVGRAPLLIKVVLVAAALVLWPFALPFALVGSAIAVAQKRPGRAAAYATATWVFPVAIFAHVYRAWTIPLLILPFALAWVAGTKTLARSHVPCRTTAWTMLWSIPAGFILLRIWPHQPLIGVVAAVLIALAILGWRLAKAVQDERMYGPDGAGQARRPGPGPGGTYSGEPIPAGTAPVPLGGRHPGGPGYGVPARAAATPYAEHAVREHAASAPRPRTQISVEDAMAELDAMIGLTPVKEQVRSIAASIEAARRRAVAGVTTDKPMRHFVFLGPPGTGKTTVARVLAKIFYAFGLLEMPEVREAHRADLVGEYLGATAVQTLLKRAEDDRENLIIILAGYEKQMETFLASNPGLASRFATRLKFPSYAPPEMRSLAEAALRHRGEELDPDASPALSRILEEVGRRRITDDLGNGRFVRSLLEKAGQARDVRVMARTAEPSREDLVTIHAGDIEQAFTELTSRLRGYEDTPTVEGAIAELDELVGLAPVKQQVRAIAAQLRVAKLRDTHGLTSQPPARHFVFTGPPGTGKTTVARILGRIFAALGLLVRPEVVEAHRGDLVGEHLGSTAIKTGRLVDSAMGGVLFIDEAYSLHNDGYSGGDAFGAEAVQTLLKRAEDDRDRLVIVLAGYPDDMDRFLRSNPGLASRFSTRVTCPSYRPGDLVQIARLLAEQAGDVFEPGALDALGVIFAHACEAGRIDELGNGRFARSLFERACAFRDVRVVRLGDQATAADLTTVTTADVEGAYRDLAVSGQG